MSDSSKCPFCKGSGFATDVFVNEYILQVLQHLITDLKTDKSQANIVDKYAGNLTAYMNGRILDND